VWLPALKFLGLHFGPRQFAFTSDLIQHQNQELLLLLSAYFAIFIKSCAWTPHSYKNMPALCISRVKSSVVKPVTPHPSVRKQGSGVRLHKGGHYLPRMQLLYWDCILEWSTRAPGIITWVKHGSLGQEHSRVPCNTGWKSSFCLQTASHGIWSLCFSWIVQILQPVAIWVFCSGESALKSSHSLPQ
jgi:hypothetical protein